MDLVWLVPYEPGVLVAKGKRNGEVVSEMEVVTSGDPAKIQLLADRQAIKADRQNVVHVEVNILDNNNHFVPHASNRIQFKIDGEASIIAVDNGDPLNEESFDSPSRKVFNGKCLVIVKSNGKPGQLTLTAEAEGLEEAEITVLTR